MLLRVGALGTSITLVHSPPSLTNRKRYLWNYATTEKEERRKKKRRRIVPFDSELKSCVNMEVEQSSHTSRWSRALIHRGGAELSYIEVEQSSHTWESYSNNNSHSPLSVFPGKATATTTPTHHYRFWRTRLYWTRCGHPPADTWTSCGAPWRRMRTGFRTAGVPAAPYILKHTEVRQIRSKVM